MFNEVMFLQILIIMSVFFFIQSANLFIVWYISGFFLFLIGFVMLLDDGDILIGFLWLIDLGVGLVFFIFILHFSSFLYKKTKKNINTTFILFVPFLVLFIFIIFYTVNFSSVISTQESFTYWFFNVSWYDFYDFFMNTSKTDLNILREIYFYNNSFEFIIINFCLLYGIVSSIVFFFLLKKVMVFLNLKSLLDLNFNNGVNEFFFIRNQDFLKQQKTFPGLRVFKKTKKNDI